MPSSLSSNLAQPSLLDSERPIGGPLYPVFLVFLVLSKQRRRLLCLTALAPVVALWILPYLPKSYKSEAVIQIRKSLSTAYAEDIGLKPTEAAGQISEDYRVVQTALLESQLLHDAVGRSLLGRGYFEGSPSLRGQARELVLALFSTGAEQQYVDHLVLEERRAEDAGRFVSAGLSIRRGHKSPKISLSFQDGDPQRASQVLETLLAEYQESLASIYDLAPILEEATDHLAHAESSWALARGELGEFKTLHDLQDPQQALQASRHALAIVVAKLTQTRVDHAAASSRVVALDGASELVPKEFETSPTRYENRYRWMVLDLLTVARKRLVESPFLEGTPEFAALQKPIEELSAEFDAQQSLTSERNVPTPNTSHYKVIADLALARADEQAAASTLTILSEREVELGQEIERVAGLLPEYSDYLRKVQELAETREAKLHHVHQLQRVKDLGDADLLWSYKVLQEPTQPSTASSPGRSILFLGLSLLGFAVAVMTTLLSGLLDSSIRESRELEKLVGVKPLAAFPDLSQRAEISRLLRRMGRGFLGGLEARKIAKLRASLFNFSQLGPHSAVLESRLDALISAVEMDGAGESGLPAGPVVFAVGGTHGGVGATTIAVNLARRISERKGGRTLLALRKEGSHCPQSGEAIEPGLNLHLGKADVLFYSEVNLPNARDWARKIGRDYDRVVLDAPPALSSRLSLDLLSSSDVALLVARGDVTKRSALEEAVHAVNNAGTAKVGIVLNAQHSRLPDLLTCA